MDNQNQQLDPKVTNIVKALAYTENGGQPNLSNLKAGKSGETKSMLQFLPETWKEFSKSASGQDNLPMTPENEATVAYAKVADWLKHGYTPEQVFSMWNSGRPNAYKQGNKGVNKSGVAYDTPAYVKKATNYLKQFEDKAAVATSQTDTQNKNPTTSEGQVAMSSPGMLDSQQTPPFTLKRKSGLLKPQKKEIQAA